MSTIFELIKNTKSYNQPIEWRIVDQIYKTDKPTEDYKYFYWKVLEENEAFIYSYFIQNELFFENQSKEKQKYMSERPSTYEISPQVPGRIGRWLGWKIVSSYMDQNQITLEELLLEVDFKKIFYNSNYKPT